MSEYDKILKEWEAVKAAVNEQFKRCLRELRHNCPHTETAWCYGKVSICKRCNKRLDNRPLILKGVDK